jgi:hypothetical protein
MSVAVLILGMHRSGTSATAGLLQFAGVDLGSNLTPPQEDNPRGFFEHDEVWQLHQRLLRDLGSEPHDSRAMPTGWLETDAAQRARADLVKVLTDDFASSPIWGVKDPRLSRLFPLWPAILQNLQAEPRVVLTLRHPLESARSIVHRDRRDLPHALGLWLRYTLDAERSTRQYRRTLVQYSALLSDWRAVFRRINEDLDLQLPAITAQRELEIASFLDSDLRHQRAEANWIDGNHPVPIAEWCDSVYRAMQRLPDEVAIATIDQVATSFSRLESEAAIYCCQITDHIKEIHLLRSGIAQLESHREQLVARIQWLDSEHARLSSRIHELDTEHVRLSSRIHELEAEHVRLSSRIHELETEHVRLSSRIHELETEHVRLSSRIHELETEHVRLSSRIHDLDSELARLNCRVNEQELRARRAEDRNRQLEAELLKAETKLESSRNEVWEMQQSRSWRITQPLRTISRKGQILRSVFKR